VAAFAAPGIAQRQPTVNTCWAAVATGAAKAFGVGGPKWVSANENNVVKAFAKNYRKHLTGRNAGWDQAVPVGQFQGVLNYAGINQTPQYAALPGSLNAGDVMNALRHGRLVLCVRTTGGAHVTTLWKACQPQNGGLLVCVHDPWVDTWQADLSFGTFARNRQGFVVGA
jgi:hypothetical protein